MSSRLSQSVGGQAMAQVERGGKAGQVRRALPNGWMIAALIIAAFAAVPLAAVIVAAPGGGIAALARLADTVLAAYILNTAGLMAIAGIAALMLGISTAWLVSACEFPGRRFFAWALLLPLAVPSYLAAYIYADLLDYSGPVQSSLRALSGWQAGEYWFFPIRSLAGGGIILGLVLYPYVYLIARAAFASQSRAQFVAARSLGASPARAFWQVSLPGARPAIASGLALVLMEVLADFGVADYFAIPTFSTGIFRSWLAMGDKQAALGLAALMLIVVAALVLLEARTRKGRSESRDGFGAQANETPLVRLTAGRRALASLLCALPIIAGFCIPVWHLATLAFLTNGGFLGSAQPLGPVIASSLKLGVSVAFVCAGLALVLGFARARSSRTSLKVATRIATLGYTLPGALLAVGLLAPLGYADQALTRFARDVLGYGGGLVLAGSGLILVYALSVRFLTVAFNTADAGIARLPASLDAAARSLGARSGRVLGRIYLPLLRPSLLAAFALVFIDTLRELPATLILRPFNFETLATRTYRLASDERLAEASLPALILLAAGLIPVLVLVAARRRG